MLLFIWASILKKLSMVRANISTQMGGIRKFQSYRLDWEVEITDQKKTVANYFHIISRETAEYIYCHCTDNICSMWQVFLIGFPSYNIEPGTALSVA